jgi:hypothetical protein
MKKQFLLPIAFLLILVQLNGQGLRLPNSAVNLPSKAGRTVGVTEIEIRWNSPGVKGREGKIWGTEIAPYGYEVLGFGSDKPSPWRAGADESTTIRFSTDVKINGRSLKAGNYGLFIALYPDSSVLIFNKNAEGWGAYFYNSEQDVLRVKIQRKSRKESVRLVSILQNRNPTQLR